MDKLDLIKEFDKIEKKIKQYKNENKDIKDLLKTKARLLQVAYSDMSSAMHDGRLKQIAENFAKELAFLNNIQKIQDEIKEELIDIKPEIQKIYDEMREKGLGWLLDNIPQKVEKSEK